MGNSNPAKRGFGCDEARRQLQIEEDMRSVSQYYMLIDLMDLEDGEKEIARMKYLLKKDRSNLKTAVKLGIARRKTSKFIGWDYSGEKKTRNYLESIDGMLGEAIHLDPNNVHVLYNSCLLFLDKMKKGDGGESWKLKFNISMEKMRRLHPESPWKYFLEAFYLSDQGNYDSCLEYVKRHWDVFQEEETTYEYSLSLQISSLQSLGMEYEKSLLFLLKRFPNSLWGYRELGWMYLQMDVDSEEDRTANLVKARNTFLLALEIHSGYHGFNFLVGRCHEMEGNFRMAVQYYSRELKRYPTHKFALYKRAVSYERIGKSKLAFRDCETLIYLEPTIENHLHFARMVSDSGQIMRSIGIQVKLLNEFSGDKERYKIHCDMARNYGLMGDFSQSLFEINQAIGINPSHLFSYKTRADCMFFLGRFRDAIRDYEYLIKEGYDSCSDAFFCRGIVYAKFITRDESEEKTDDFSDTTSNLRLAISSFQQVLKCSDTSIETRLETFYEIGDCHHSLGDYSNSYEFFFKGMELSNSRKMWAALKKNEHLRIIKAEVRKKTAQLIRNHGVPFLLGKRNWNQHLEDLEERLSLLEDNHMMNSKKISDFGKVTIRFKYSGKELWFFEFSRLFGI